MDNFLNNTKNALWLTFGYCLVVLTLVFTGSAEDIDRTTASDLNPGSEIVNPLGDTSN